MSRRGDIELLCGIQICLRKILVYTDQIIEEDLLNNRRISRLFIEEVRI